ncbi:MAG: TetR/AcrR family transcriptional regulator [Hyphomonadaceae bacterium]|nr:TetR/AcrR family transcriptional regulator [Hyphomonadaceae bacterium]
MAAQPAETLRRVLLDASLALIEAEGLEAFSMREVARRAGVSHQAPYHHFENREAILAAIVAEGFQELRDRCIAARDGETEPAKRFTAIGRAYLDFALRRPAHFKLMFRSELVREDKHSETLACAQGAYDVLLQAADEVAKHSGHDHRLIVVLAWSTVHGLATLMLEGKLDKAVLAPDEREQAGYAAIVMLEALWKP